MTTKRRYYDDSFEQNFEARVLACEPITGQKRNGVAVAAWAVTLDETALYPSSGGQPNDFGKIGDANVLDVLDEGDEIIHVMDAAVEIGLAKGCVDWERRFDHMQQHTGQHLLSAVFQERFGLPTVSFHLGAELCTIDLRGPEPSTEVLEGAERAANRVVYEDRPVAMRYGTAEQFAEMGVRKEVERKGTLRAIEIEGIDLQPCGGTHVRRTGQIGMILLRRCTKMRQDWRVEFVCGRRAERMARDDHRLLTEAAGKLKCAPADLAKTVESLCEERDAQHKKLLELFERLAEAEATLLLQTTMPDAMGRRVIAKSFENAAPEYLGTFATQLAKTAGTVALIGSRISGNLVFAQHASAKDDMHGLLKKVLDEQGGKGGGSKDFARGKLSDASRVDEALERAKQELTSR